MKKKMKIVLIIFSYIDAISLINFQKKHKIQLLNFMKKYFIFTFNKFINLSLIYITIIEN